MYKELIKNPNFFPEIEGDLATKIGHQIDWSQFSLTFVDEKYTIQEALAWALGGQKPDETSPKREMLAELLAHFSLHILLSHELSHIFCGHCDMLSRDNLQPIVERVDVSVVDYVDKTHIKRLWEVEADLISTTIMFNKLNVDYQLKQFESDFNFIGIDCSLENFVGLYYLCANIIFVALGNIEDKHKHLNMHPHFITRSRIVLLSIMSGVSSMFPQKTREEIIDLIHKYENSIGSALNNIPYKSSLGRENIKEFVRNSGQESDELLIQLQKSREIWKNYSLIQLLN